MNPYRVKRGSARIDYNRPVNFTFDNKSYQGYEGDTLASALLAEGTRMIGRSFKYGRPRGIYGAGAEEPNALMQLELGAYTVPDAKATQIELYEGLIASTTTGWPSLNFDAKGLLGKLGRFMPPGFYYKTFMKPDGWWPFYEELIRKAAGYAEAPREADPESYDHLHHHVDVIVVGGGVCGITAALIAARSGLKTIIIDEQNEMGGWLLSDAHQVIDGQSGAAWLAKSLAELDASPLVTRLPRATAFAMHDYNMIQVVEQIQDHLPIANREPDVPRQRIHNVRAHHIVLATGTIERPLVFGYNDLPGILTNAAGQTYLNRYGVQVGKEVLIQTSNDYAYETARDLAESGARVWLADTRAFGASAERQQAAKAAGAELLLGYGIAKAHGSKKVTGADLVRLDPFSNKVVGRGPHVNCDALLSSGGQSPTVHLFCHNGGRPVWDEKRLAFVVPEAGRPGIACVGSVTGNFVLADAIAQTGRAMQAVCESLGKAAVLELPNAESPEVAQARKIFRVPDGKPEGEGAKAFIDFQNDVDVGGIYVAVRENFRNIEHVKRYTALGFGTDQGKLSNVNGFAIAAEALGKPISEVGTTTYRPSYTPVTFGALAGHLQGDTFEPRRYTSIQPAHEARGAKFEVVGQWMRPWYFPQGNEDLHTAVNRECVSTRNRVGVMDASTLGKIDVRGPDAREFLNRVYSNAWTKLEPGKCRYGLMLDENGMVMDDGVTACIGENHFHMTTTSGGAAKVLGWLERWHQTEWPELKVYFSSVTDHWSTVAIVGPESRKVLAKLCKDIDLSASAFKFMDGREGTVAGLPARVFRISFSGEVAYEVNVDASYGHYLWEEVMKAGKEFDITPYGTETMHVLRAEKGYIIVGQDSDGSVSPIDLNMSWAVGMKKPFSFLGRRSLTRSDTVRTDRKQLVGLLPEDPTVVLAEGAQIVEAPVAAPKIGETPVKMFGHVTSSYYSAFMGRSIAMAVVKGGLHRMGETVYVWAGGKVHKATIASSVFLDPQGERQNG